MTPEQITTGADLRQWRTERRLTQPELGALLDVTRVTVGRWERGEGNLPRWVPLAIGGLDAIAAGRSDREK